MQKVLVANRGEIALRIMRSLREEGVASVAIYSGQEGWALHARMADEALKLRGRTLAETYLNVEQVIALAMEAGADAIHPGYGFLSESPAFAEAVRDAGLLFIGPSAEAIRLMGNKVQARNLVAGLGVPVIGGVTGSDEDLMQQAEQLGYPLLVKAAAGGGGKGMRLVTQPAELPAILEATRREARNYFGDGEIYLERYLQNPHHVEVQVMADQHGKVYSLFERECSVQRRYQKIIEEAPAPSVDPVMRGKLVEAAIRIAREINYVSAGTLEFLTHGDAFYFLEMNTRIQVEHPVTEMITGLDIVRLQLAVARGEALSASLRDLRMHGHAIEARVYAEDPLRDFLPSPGRIILVSEPGSHNGLRIDSAVDGPSDIRSDFDPMISKVISHGASREEAREKLIAALSSYAILGVRTNIPFLLQLIKAGEFRTGDTDTGLCDRFLKNGFDCSGTPEAGDELIMAAFLFALPGPLASLDGESPVRSLPADPQKGDINHLSGGIWKALGYWRIRMQLELMVNDRLVQAEPVQQSLGKLWFPDGGDGKSVECLNRDVQRMRIRCGAHEYELHYVKDGDDSVWLHLQGFVYRIQHVRKLDKEAAKAFTQNPELPHATVVRSPMAGRIVKTCVGPGEVVNMGDALVILESMKMENRIAAPGHARVERIEVAEGDLVADQAALVFLTTAFTEEKDKNEILKNESKPLPD